MYLNYQSTKSNISSLVERLLTHATIHTEGHYNGLSLRMRNLPFEFPSILPCLDILISYQLGHTQLGKTQVM